jgi:hypothetical protein
MPVEETDDRDGKTRTIEAKDTRRGIPQGSPLEREVRSSAYVTGHTGSLLVIAIRNSLAAVLHRSPWQNRSRAFPVLKR